jgi:hypothetical protein
MNEKTKKVDEYNKFIILFRETMKWNRNLIKSCKIDDFSKILDSPDDKLWARGS